MKFFFTRSVLSKKEKLEASEYERPVNVKFLLGIVFFALLIFTYNFNFEVKLNNILAGISQIDETDTLTTIDRVKINRAARALKEKTGIDLTFYITLYGVQRIIPDEQHMYIEINARDKKADVTLPFENHSIQARLENNLQICIKYNELGTCITDSVKSLHTILTQNTTTNVKEYKADFNRK